MKKLLPFLLVSISHSLNAQPVALLQWAVALSGSGNSPSYVNEITSVTIDVNNYIVIGGNVAGTIDLDPSGAVVNATSVNTTTFNGFIACYDTLHDLQWGKTLYSSTHCSINKIRTDAQRRVYVAGEYINDMDADPSSGTAPLNALAGGRDIFVSKYTPAGNYMWSLSIGGNVSLDGLNDMIVDNSGNVYITGVISDTAYFDSTQTQILVGTSGGSMFIAKYSTAGVFLWGHVIDEPSMPTVQEGNSLAFDNMGNPVVGMKYNGTVDVDPSAATVNYTASGSRDYLIIKYDHNGSYVSSFSIGGGTAGPMIDEGVIACNQNNDIVLTAEYYGTLDIDPGAAVYNVISTGNGSIFTALYSSTGTFMWAVNAGYSGFTPYINTVSFDVNSDIYVSVQFNSTSNNGVVFKYDGTGSLAYSKSIAGSNIYSRGFCIERPDVFVCGGGFKPTAIFDSTFVSGGSGYTAYLARYADCLPADIQSQSSSQDACAGENILLNVTAVGTGIVYQWFKDGNALAGDTLDHITIASSDSTDSGDYYCIVSGTCGSDTSSSIAITIHPLPVSSIIFSSGQMISSAAVSYSWFINGQSAGLFTQSITPVQSGLYFVVVTDANGCVDTSNTVTFSDIAEEGSTAFNIYPVPSDGLLYIINNNSSLHIKNLGVYDITGKLIESPVMNDDHSINIQAQPGTYFLKITSDKGIHFSRVLLH